MSPLLKPGPSAQQWERGSASFQFYSVIARLRDAEQSANSQARLEGWQTCAVLPVL